MIRLKLNHVSIRGPRSIFMSSSHHLIKFISYKWTWPEFLPESTPLWSFISIGGYSCVYTSGHWRRWRLHMEVKIVAGSLFVHCKIAYFHSVTAENWLVISLPNFVTMRKTHLSISCKIFSWIRMTKLKDTRHRILRFYKGFCSPE